MTNNDLLLALLRAGHQVLEGTMAGVSDGVARWAPPGRAHPIGAIYLHILIGEDWLVNMVARGQQPLVAGAWAGRTGASEPPPPPGTPWDAWARRVQVDLTAARAYGQAVFDATEAYLQSATQQELDRLVGERFPGGPMPVGRFLAGIVGTHVAHHTGEIAVLKGEQGLQGYPF